MPLGEKAKIKYARKFVEESKDKKRMDQFQNTREDNVCTLK
jgi:hypothetical protein